MGPTGFSAFYLGPSQVRPHYRGTPQFPFSVAISFKTTSGSALRTLQACALSVLGTSLGKKFIPKDLYLRKELPLSLQSSKGLLIAIWQRFGWISCCLNSAEDLLLK